MQAGVYLVTCIANGRRYVGSSKDIETRWREHRNDLNKKQHCNDHWQKAWNKYGASRFEWVVLEELERDDVILRGREQHWIEVLHPEFNVSQSATSTRLGAKNKASHRKKISEGQARQWARLSEDERCERVAQIKVTYNEWLNSLSKEERAKRFEYSLGQWWKNVPPEVLSELQRHGKKSRGLPFQTREQRAAAGAQRKAELKAQRQAERERKQLEWEAGRAERRKAQVEKLRQAAIAQWADPEYRAKHQAAVQAKMQDPEVLKRLSESHKGKKLSKEHRRKIGESGRGKKRSEETRRRLSEARKAWWARKKGEQ